MKFGTNMEFCDDEGLRYNADRREIYMDIKNKAILPKPNPINRPIEQRNCRELKRALDQLADEGKLNRYLKDPPKDKQKPH